jgi:hypothetical protein
MAEDPDILICINNHFKHKNILFVRMGLLGLDLLFGRDEDTNKTDRFSGRVYLQYRLWKITLTTSLFV